jgi:CheY-like chemotaxis protein
MCEPGRRSYAKDEQEMIQEGTLDARTVETSEQALACLGTNAQPLAAAETILLVEDEAFVREVTSEVLRSAGYRVLMAKDAAAAARTYDLQCGEIDLLLADVVLPGESGRALAGRLRRASPNLKVLLVTGYAEHMQAPEAGTGACLAKPFSVAALLRKVRQVLDRGENASGRN